MIANLHTKCKDNVIDKSLSRLSKKGLVMLQFMVNLMSLKDKSLTKCRDN